MIRDISDTARWVAVYRAQESERADALFRDPLAARLAGERGFEIARQMERRLEASWAFVTRTWLFDDVVRRGVAGGVDTVVNLAAGMDTRPYRLDLPAHLRWIEVDLPAILAEKQDLLARETPRCRLERVTLDLADVSARRDLFASVGGESKRTLVVSEGLLVYLPPDEVAALARDLAAPATFAHWAFDLISPGLFKMMQRTYAAELAKAGSPMRFAPAEGPRFFEPHGWHVGEARSTLKTAADLGRLSLFMRLLALLPDSKGLRPSRPWSATCLAERAVR